MRDREIGKGRQRETERERQTDRQTDREMEREQERACNAVYVRICSCIVVSDVPAK